MSVLPMSCPGILEGNEVILSRSTLLRKDRVAVDMVLSIPQGQGRVCLVGV